MDFSIPLVFIGVFIVACLSLVFVYKYGMKEKSYEEAVAEQRQHTNALLGVKPKPKEKKPKKPSKKVCYGECALKFKYSGYYNRLDNFHYFKNNF